MKFARLASRVAVGGVSAALATAGLVGVTSTTASAAPVTTKYSCTSAFPAFNADVVVDIALLPSTAPAGFPVPAGLLSFNSSFTIDNTTAGALGGLGVTGGRSDDFGTAFGDVVAKAPVVWGTATAGPSSTTFSGKGSNGAFVLPKAGTYSVTMPKTFTLQGTDSTGAPVAVAKATCSNAAPSALGSIALSKQKATVKAKAPKSAKAGAKITVKGKVTNEYAKAGGAPVTGKVIIKDGKKKVGTAKIKNGKFKASIKLAKGSHSLTVQYKGDGFTDKGESKALKVNVKA